MRGHSSEGHVDGAKGEEGEEGDPPGGLQDVEGQVNDPVRARCMYVGLIENIGCDASEGDLGIEGEPLVLCSSWVEGGDCRLETGESS